MTEFFMEFVGGFSGVVSIIFLVGFLTEVNLLIEEAIKYKFELRKGFRKKIQTQIVFFFRNSDTFLERLFGAVILFPTFYAVSLLPVWNSESLFAPSHSFWLFILVMLSAPLLQFFLQLAFYGTKGELFAIRLQEKTMAGFALLLVVVVSFTMLTAVDDIKDITSLQASGKWLVVAKPGSAILFLSLMIVVYYLCQQKIFSKAHNVFSERESQRKKFFFGIWKTAWLLFACYIFLGGGGWEVIPKVVFLNLVFVLLFEGFSRLREDQSESMVVWEMTPIILFFVLLTLVAVGLRL